MYVGPIEMEGQNWKSVCFVYFITMMLMCSFITGASGIHCFVGKVPGPQYITFYGNGGSCYGVYVKGKGPVLYDCTFQQHKPGCAKTGPEGELTCYCNKNYCNKPDI